MQHARLQVGVTPPSVRVSDEPVRFQGTLIRGEPGWVWEQHRLGGAVMSVMVDYSHRLYSVRPARLIEAALRKQLRCQGQTDRLVCRDLTSSDSRTCPIDERAFLRFMQGAYVVRAS